MSERAIRVGRSVALAMLLTVLPGALHGQEDLPVPRDLLEAVLPGAVEFEVEEGDPRVIAGYGAEGKDEVVGYAFLTSDAPPEEMGYNGPIEVLVGMDSEGVLTGVRVVDYIESYIRTRGDFLRTPGYEAQFTGKSIADPFRAGRDVRVVSRATISVSAMSRGIRSAARRVYATYLATQPSPESGGSLLTMAVEELEGMSWPDLVAGGLVPQIHVLEQGVTRIVLSFAHIRADSVGMELLGRGVLREVADTISERAREDDRLMLVGVDGALALLFYPRTLSLVQGADTARMDNEDLFMLGEPRSGMVEGQFRNVGVMVVPGTFDVERSFEIRFDLRPGMDLYSTEYPPPRRPARRVVAAPPAALDPDSREDVDDRATAPAPPPDSSVPGDLSASAGRVAPAASSVNDEAPTDTGPGQPPEGGATAENPRDQEQVPETAAGGSGTRPRVPAGEALTEAASPESEPAAPLPAEETVAGDVPLPESPAPASQEELSARDSGTSSDLDFSFSEEETVLQRTLGRTSPAEVAGMLALLALATVAFLLKRERLRWVVLVATFLYLGWIDGGFLSVSHITAAISVGPGVFLEDIPLLLFVAFTAVTTLLAGRVFCGFLCPFGALQDFLSKLVPRRFQRDLPQALHKRLWIVKYLCLAAILLPALAGSRASIFPFFEPFGTVFFLSSSLVLWSIALAMLTASAFVPRFYCRYICPLGAALAVPSLVSPLRIRRVEHCDHCKVCEHACPTGAITGPRIHFHECVRCNLCETKLIEQAGVCRHDIGEVRRRLVQLQTSSARGSMV